MPSGEIQRRRKSSNKLTVGNLEENPKEKEKTSQEEKEIEELTRLKLQENNSSVANSSSPMLGVEKGRSVVGRTYRMERSGAMVVEQWIIWHRIVRGDLQLHRLRALQDQRRRR